MGCSAMATVWTLQLLHHHHHHVHARPAFFARQHHSRNLLEFPMQVQGRIIAAFFGRRTPDSAPTPNFVPRAFTHPVTNSSGDASDPNNRIPVPDQVSTAVNNHHHHPHRHRNSDTPPVTLNESQTPAFQLHHTIASLPPFIFSMKRYFTTSFTVGLCAAATILLIVIRSYANRKSRYTRPGSVADLVRRGQLRSDRRGISTPLKYDDPFNNPMVKVGEGNSTVEMCGKVYRLAPVTLTKEQAAIHQKRRSRAYQWKRPKVFLKEGDSIPPDVDPDTVRWIPANHPFATTASDIDEDLAQSNVYQKHGVPFRIQAEHEALQRKLEALQNEQKLDKLVIDPGAAKDFERPFKPHLKSEDQIEKGPSSRQMGLKNSNSDSVHNPTLSRQAAEEMENP